MSGEPSAAPEGTDFKIAALSSIKSVADYALRMVSSGPKLLEPYTMADYARFMIDEIPRYSARYVRQSVDIAGAGLLSRLKGRGILFAFLHYGSWTLAGGAINHTLGIPYTAIASRRNLRTMPQNESTMWSTAHTRINRFYARPMFFTDESPRLALSWLRGGGALGVLLDVREPEQRYQEHEFTFLGQRIYMQTGAARLARLARVPIIPASIQFQATIQRHRLQFFPPIIPNDDSRVTTQAVLHDLSTDVGNIPQQQFHEILREFSQRESP